MASMTLVGASQSTSIFPMPSPSSTARALIVLKDQYMVWQVKSAMSRLAIQTEVCNDTSYAQQLLSTRKFDMVTFDLDIGKRTVNLLEALRASPSNHLIPAVVITRKRSVSSTVDSHTIVLRRPVTSDSLQRALNLGYGAVLREWRRYYRCRVGRPVLIRRVDMRETRCQLINISEGGIGITSAPARLTRGTRVHAEFTLPGQMSRFSAVCETRWRDRRGRAGLRFMLMPLEQRCDLQQWLATRLEQSLPQPVAERVRDINERYRCGTITPS